MKLIRKTRPDGQSAFELVDMTPDEFGAVLGTLIFGARFADERGIAQDLVGQANEVMPGLGMALPFPATFDLRVPGPPNQEKVARLIDAARIANDTLASV